MHVVPPLVFHVAVFPFQACQQTNGAGMRRIRQEYLDDFLELFVLPFVDL